MLDDNCFGRKPRWLVGGLSRRAVPSAPARPGWMRDFGALRRLRKETARVQAKIDHAFEVVESEDRL